MKSFLPFLLLPFLTSANPLTSAGPLTSDPSPADTLSSFLTRRGLPFEDHTVTTADGYILQTHRIPNPGKPVVYLQHGILADTWSWISNTNELGVGQNLYSQGYDVWFGNSRGNTYGKNHTTLDPSNDKEFWAFSFAEMGREDVPSTIKYILGVTGKPNLVYAAWSQGNTAMLIALQTTELKAFLEETVSVAVMLSPVSYMKHSTSSVLSTVSALHIGSLVESIYPYSFLGQGDNDGLSKIEQFFCKITFGVICKIAVDVFCGTSELDDPHTLSHAFTSKFPAGTSVHDLNHYEQLIGEFPRELREEETFAEFDFGTNKKNQQVYGVPVPPKYDLKSVADVPIALFCAGHDDLVQPDDLNLLVADIGVAGADKIVYQRMFTDFSHVTWLVGYQAAFETWTPDFFSIIAKYAE